MRLRRFVTIGAVLIAVSIFGGAGEAQRSGGSVLEAPPVEDLNQLIFFAVLEGLYEDGASNDAVDIVLLQERPWDGGGYMHFVYGCGLCTPALDAFRVYRERPKLSYKGEPDTFGTGLEDGIVRQLRSDSIEDRLGAIDGLIRRWVRRRLDRMRLTPEEAADWWERVTIARKKGMELLRSYQERGEAGAMASAKGCAICDGASAACEAPGESR